MIDCNCSMHPYGAACLVAGFDSLRATAAFNDDLVGSWCVWSHHWVCVCDVQRGAVGCSFAASTQVAGFGDGQHTPASSWGVGPGAATLVAAAMRVHMSTHTELSTYQERRTYQAPMSGVVCTCVCGMSPARIFGRRLSGCAWSCICRGA